MSSKFRLFLIILHFCATALNANNFKLGVIGLQSTGNSRDPGLELTGEDLNYKETDWNINLYGGIIEYAFMKNIPLLSRLQVSYGKKDKVLFSKNTISSWETNLKLFILDISIMYRLDIHEVSTLDLGLAIGYSEAKYTDKIKDIFYSSETLGDNIIKTNYTYSPTMNLNIQIMRKLYFQVGILYRYPQPKYKVVRFIEDPLSSHSLGLVYAKSEIDNYQIIGSLLISF